MSIIMDKMKDFGTTTISKLVNIENNISPYVNGIDDIKSDVKANKKTIDRQTRLYKRDRWRNTRFKRKH